MPRDPSSRRVALRGRSRESAELDGLLADIASGQSRALLLVGEAGVGKSALLQYLEAAAGDLDVVRAVGVEAEMELAYAGLHQLCAPLLDRVERLPGPQRDALDVVFGRAAGAAPDRFLVGLAVLSLLAEVAEEGPLLCVVDDAQWLDHASGQVLAFVARRLQAEPVAMVFAARRVGEALRGLPELRIEGLRNGDARALLNSALRVTLDERVRDRIVAETRGNPLALLELPQGLSARELAGGFGLLGDRDLSGHIEESFIRRLETFPDETRLLLLAAAAEPVGDPLLLWAAVQRLGVGISAVDAAATDGLLTIGERVTFRHPLVRSAVYRYGSPRERRAAHLALAEATDPVADPDRRAWHLAAAAAGPDEEIAAELERSADRAQARGGMTAAAAFLHRAVELSAEPGRRVERALAGADLSLQAGSVDSALGLLQIADDGPLDELQQARLDLLRAGAVYAQRRGNDAPALLLQAARSLERFDPDVARDTYLDAWSAGLFAGHLSDAESLQSISRAILASPVATQGTRATDQLLSALARAVIHGRAAACGELQRVAALFATGEATGPEVLRWGWQACVAAVLVWDLDTCLAIAMREVQTSRDLGALAVLSVAANVVGQSTAMSGDFGTAELFIAEANAVTDSIDTAIAPYGALVRAGLQAEPDAMGVIEPTVTNATAVGQGIAVEYARWASARLYNGLGRYAEAMTVARQVADATPELYVSPWALAELTEAAVRAGDRAVAEEALERLEPTIAPVQSDWGLGILARSRALLSEGQAAEGLYREAVERLARARIRPDAARAHLIYGEWLRREGRRTEARTELRAAYDQCTRIGMPAYAARARAELEALGATVRARTASAREALSEQELHIARLARDGLSNPEIGARLFLSPRTVEWHLRKVFAKLGISSRRELTRALTESGA